MYPISRSVFIFIYPIWLGLGLNFVGGIVSDGNLFSIDVLGDDTGSNLFLPEVDEYSLTDQSLDTVATEDHLFDDKLLADNLLVDDRFATNLPTDNVLDDSVLSGGVQSCVQAPGRLRARENSCSNPSTPTNSDFTEEDQRVLTTEEVENYWCAKNPRKLNLGLKAVCNVQPLAGPFEEVLTSTLLTGLNYLVCKDWNVYCCYAWHPNWPINTSPLALTPVGQGLWCFKTFNFGTPAGLDDSSPYFVDNEIIERLRNLGDTPWNF